MWIKNTAGVKDSMLTFALGGFVVTALAVIASFVERITVSGFDMAVRSPDVALVTIFLGATLTAYVTRRNNKDKAKLEKEMIILKKEVCPECNQEEEDV